MLDSLLGSKTRAGILSVLIGDGERPRLLELHRMVGTSVSSVQKELAHLERTGLVRSERSAEGRRIEAVPTHPYFGPLRALLAADAGELPVDTAAPRVNPRVAPHVADITDACRRHSALSAALVGSSTQGDATIVPADLDILVRFEPDPRGYADRYFGLLEELERIMGMPVDIIEEDALGNAYLASRFAATRVVLYEAA